jgi:hypothetical protein
MSNFGVALFADDTPASTAMLSATMQLQFTNELLLDKSNHPGNDMTIADAPYTVCF